MSKLEEYPMLLRRMVYYKYWVKLYGRHYAKKLLKRYKRVIPAQFEYPTELQLPITYKCNCDCIMCGMHEMAGNPGFAPEELDAILEDELFREITGVGVNGGEPFLLPNLCDYVEVLLNRLPKLQHVYIISNGSVESQMFTILKKIYTACHDKNVKLHLTVSIDGIGKVHDIVRGRKNIFEKAERTCEKLKNTEGYCDSFGTICTITRKNIAFVNEVEVWAAQKGISVSYNIATEHARLQNSQRFESFSIFSDESARHLTMEFFYSRFLKTLERKYFALYYYVKTGKRIAGCNCHSGSVTLTPNSMLAYCATHSKEIGMAEAGTAKKVYEENLAHRKELFDKTCDTCSHYMYDLTEEGEKLYIQELLKHIGKPGKFRAR